MFARLAPFTLILATLALWRLTHLFWGEDGPGGIFVRLRRMAGTGFWGSLLDCFYCLSLWFSVPLAWMLGESWRERLLLWFALSAGAILLERATTPASPVAPAATWCQDPPAGFDDY